MAKREKAMAGSRPVIKDEVRKVADLKVDPRNAKKHSEAQIGQILHSIEEFGYIEKIVIRPNGMLVGGEGRLEAIKRLGTEELEVRVVSGLSETAYAALGLALNRIGENGRWDDEILREILNDIQNEGVSAISLGFSPGELDKILGETAELEVREIETGPVNDEFWISIRGPLAHQAHALKALQEAMKPYSGVTVEQGTIAVA